MAADGTLRSIALVLGGARSGKSAYAERLVEESGLKPVYLATGQAGDEEMAARIAGHRARRGTVWTTVEEPLALGAALRANTGPDRAVLVDCLTLWLGNLMAAGADVERECAGLVAGVEELDGPVVFVSNEVGMGIVPENALARAFRDHAGQLHQALAARADVVYLVVAGLAQVLKQPQG